MTDVAIVVPGIMGSVLKLGEEVVWPGSAWEYWKESYAKMEQLKVVDLTPADLIRQVAVLDVYGSLLRALERCGFEEKPRSGKPTLYVLPYDWRKDNRLAAERLAELIGRALAEHPGETRITLVAHSMGGLVCRYYLESGKFQGPGISRVVRLITLGTPHRGAPEALPGIRGLEKKLWLDGSQVREIAQDPKFPALYQLLPPQDEPFVWNDDPAQEYGHVDVYAEPVANRLALNLQSLEAARAFHSKLNANAKPAHVRYFCFYGASHITVSSLALQPVSDGYRISKIDPRCAGDGTVPVWSGMLPGHQGRPVEGEHGTIFRDGYLRQTLGVLLGKKGVLGPGDELGAEGVQVSVRERVVHPGSLIHVSLVLQAEDDSATGTLRLERAVIAAEGDPAAAATYIPLGPATPVRAAGARAEPAHLQLTLVAPQIAGVFRLAFYWDPAGTPVATDVCFVQQPSSAIPPGAPA
jgi:pimeloyl-ACP methyl ester carboxylesterase